MNTFYMPTRILSGEHVVREKYQMLQGMGHKALIVTGRRSSKANGSLKDMEEALGQAGIGYVIFDEVEENPSLETMERAGRLGRAEKVEFIVGIGGGSPIDAAKFIGILVKNPELTGKDVFATPNLQSFPVVAVPTTAGTGTEVTQYAIVTLAEEKTKKNYGQMIFPTLAFLDPGYMEELPLAITVNTAVDALSHLVEGYLNRNAGVLSDALAEAGMRIWGECAGALLAGNLTLKEREKLMIASTLGGMLIAQTGTSLPHGMGYALTFHKGMPHGLANGILYVEYLRSFKNREKVEKLPFLLGLKDYAALEDLLKKLTQTEVAVSEEELKEYSRGMVENRGKLANHPEEISYEELYGIYRNSLIH